MIRFTDFVGASVAIIGSSILFASPSSATLLEGTHDALYYVSIGDASLGLGTGPTGDINGDGYSDILLSSTIFSGLPIDGGDGYMFLGSAAGLSGGEVGFADAHIESDQPAGALFTGAGDINGDGYDDVIFAMPVYDVPSAPGNFNGAAFIFLGSANGIVGCTTGPAPHCDPSSAATRLEGEQSGELLGFHSTSAGDVNGDGYDDVIIGDNYESAYIFLGSAAGIPDGGPSTADAKVETDQAISWFGYSMSTAGDVNGDGYDDIVIGACIYDGLEGIQSGAAFVFHGSAAGIASGDVSTAATTLIPDQEFEPDSFEDAPYFGCAVAGGKDVNGDGYDDIVVGSYGYRSPDPFSGAAFVFHGSATGIPDGGVETADTRLEADAGDWFGESVAMADANGDGYGDVIVGATAARAAYVFFGGADGIEDGGPASADVSLESNLAGFGFNVAGAGDTNGDGFDDILVGNGRRVLAYEGGNSVCADGVDNDGDGLADFPEDTGCTSPDDDSERDAFYPCDDGIDNDGDGWADFDPVTFANPGDANTLPAGNGDPGCRNPTWIENPSCQNGVEDRDNDNHTDYDGGYSITGVPGQTPDPDCVGKPWHKEWPVCGMGPELTVLIPLMLWGRRRLIGDSA